MPERMARAQEEQCVEQRLDALLEQRPELAPAVAFYRGALPTLRIAGTAVVPFEYSTETAERKLAAGIPLLAGEALPFDPPTLLALFGMLCRVAESAADLPPSGASGTFQHGHAEWPGTLAAAAAHIREAAEQDGLDLPAIVAGVAAGNRAQIYRVASRLELDAGLLVLLVQNTLKPMLRSWGGHLAEQVNTNGWGRGICPICGSQPALAELQGSDEGDCGATHFDRYLLCALCGSRWPYPSDRCAFCGTSDPAMLTYFSTEDEEEQHYVQGCSECRGYLKTVLTRAPLPPDFIVAEDLATMHLDTVASEQGFTRRPWPGI